MTIVLGLALSTAQIASAGIDQTYTKAQGKRTWGEIFNWAMGAEGFDKSYALVIGISEYTGDFEPLRSTRNDPIRMKDFLLDEAGFDYVHVLTDEKAHITRIRQLMKGEFPSLVKPNDRFLFYWSGHGTQATDTLGRTVGYLPLAESKQNETWTMIGMDELSDWDRWIKAQHALFLLDACFSGLAGSEAKVTLQDFTIERLSKPAHHLISAGTGDQQTIAGERWNGSIFTDSIIRAARGEADAQTTFPRDGVVNLAELLAFVRQRVDHERRSAKWDEAITPQWNHLRSNQGEFFFITKEKKIETAKLEGDTTGELDDGMPIVLMGPGPTDTVTCDSSTDQLFWESIKNETQPAYFEAYLARVDAGELCGLFRDVARLKVQTLPQSPPKQTIEVQLSPERIRQVQEMLVALGFDAGKADGVLGARTRAAVIGFQRSIDSKVTGALTEADEIALAMAYADRIASGGSTDSSDKNTEVGTQVAVGVFPDGSVFRDCRDCPEMVVVPAGRFTMGSPESEPERSLEEGPAHEVNVRAFALGRYEVTFAEYKFCVQDGVCSNRLDDAGWGRDNRPVINVTWNDAQSYVTWLSGKTGTAYRLPSEAEWEYAARASARPQTPFSFGRTIAPDQANYDGNISYDGGPTGRDLEKTAPVGSYPANAFGFHDMHGNVWEWVEDCWHDSYTGAPGDGGAWTSGGDCGVRVLRGGSWHNEPRFLRSANRSWSDTGNRNSLIGFRVAITLDR